MGYIHAGKADKVRIKKPNEKQKKAAFESRKLSIANVNSLIIDSNHNKKNSITLASLPCEILIEIFLKSNSLELIFLNKWFYHILDIKRTEKIYYRHAFSFCCDKLENIIKIYSSVYDSTEYSHLRNLIPEKNILDLRIIFKHILKSKLDCFNTLNTNENQTHEENENNVNIYQSNYKFRKYEGFELDLILGKAISIMLKGSFYDLLNLEKFANLYSKKLTDFSLIVFKKYGFNISPVDQFEDFQPHLPRIWRQVELPNYFALNNRIKFNRFFFETFSWFDDLDSLLANHILKNRTLMNKLSCTNQSFLDLMHKNRNVDHDYEDNFGESDYALHRLGLNLCFFLINELEDNFIIFAIFKFLKLEDAKEFFADHENVHFNLLTSCKPNSKVHPDANFKLNPDVLKSIKSFENKQDFAPTKSIAASVAVGAYYLTDLLLLFYVNRFVYDSDNIWKEINTLLDKNKISNDEAVKARAWFRYAKIIPRDVDLLV